MKYSKLFKKLERKFMYGQYTHINNIRKKNSWDTETFEDYCGRCYVALRFQQLAPLFVDDGI